MTDNGKPKYFSLMEQLRSDIMSGAIRPGEKLPSENELSQKYSLSRHTVQKITNSGSAQDHRIFTEMSACKVAEHSKMIVEELNKSRCSSI